jgi:hypothetical protein
MIERKTLMWLTSQVIGTEAVIAERVRQLSSGKIETVRCYLECANTEHFSEVVIVMVMKFANKRAAGDRALVIKHQMFDSAK